ncbi:MAG: hypothetical protein WKF95_06525 [Rubrobacter sp.]
MSWVPIHHPLDFLVSQRIPQPDGEHRKTLLAGEIVESGLSAGFEDAVDLG